MRFFIYLVDLRNTHPRYIHTSGSQAVYSVAGFFFLFKNYKSADSDFGTLWDSGMTLSGKMLGEYRVKIKYFRLSASVSLCAIRPTSYCSIANQRNTAMWIALYRTLAISCVSLADRHALKSS